jgi:UDP-N-acetylmuramoyl-L-alanyl-D-glutamate--2,6-diaminopimelate ligase
VRRRDLFFACAGRKAHGLTFAADAVRAGAAAVAWEPAPGVQAPVLPVPVVAVAQLVRKLGQIADRYYGAPSAAVTVAGVTGTNGKTSCTFFVAQAASALGRRCGVSGTLGAGFVGALESVGLTTPDAITVHRTLADLRGRGARAVAMEVSSHALDQGRADGVRRRRRAHEPEPRSPRLSRRHGGYGAAKRVCYGARAACRRAELRRRLGRALVARVPGRPSLRVIKPRDRCRRGLARCELGQRRRRLAFSVRGSFGAGELRTRLLGAFNADNLLAALGVLVLWGFGMEDAAGALSRVVAPPGRMERFGGGPGHPLVIVDYAHSPDALAKALAAARAHCRGELWCVFGCGGDRDPGKRPQMGAIAEAHAEHVIVTNDNPRTEDPARIVADILAGMRMPEQAIVERDRRAAIASALHSARPGDAVLVAGKGHEDYQIIGAQRLAFSDRAVIAGLLGAKP